MRKRKKNPEQKTSIIRILLLVIRGVVFSQREKALSAEKFWIEAVIFHDCQSRKEFRNSTTIEKKKRIVLDTQAKHRH